MSSYTPTTEEIVKNVHDYVTLAPSEFDRWLIEHDAEVYQRGREDAAKAVEALRDPSIAIPTIAMAVAAARGDGNHE